MKNSIFIFLNLFLGLLISIESQAGKIYFNGLTDTRKECSKYLEGISDLTTSKTPDFSRTGVKRKSLSRDQIRIALQAVLTSIMEHKNVDLNSAKREVNTAFFRQRNAFLDEVISNALQFNADLDFLYESLTRKFTSPTAAIRILFEPPS